MRNIKKVIALFLLIIAIYFIQFSLINENTLFGIKPNLILVSVIVVSLFSKVAIAGTYGIFAGFIIDTIYNNSYEKIGIFTIIYTLIAIITHFIGKKYLKKNVISLVYLIIIGTILFEVLEYFFYIINYSSTIKISRLLFGTILSVIFNSGFGIIIYNLILKLELKDNKSVYFK